MSPIKFHTPLPRIPSHPHPDPDTPPIEPIPRETTGQLGSARRATDPDRYFLGRRGLLPVMILALLWLQACQTYGPPKLPTAKEAMETTAKVVPPAELAPLFVEYRDRGEITQRQLEEIIVTLGWDCCLFPDVCGAAYCLPGCRKCGLPPVAPDGNEPEAKP